MKSQLSTQAKTDSTENLDKLLTQSNLKVGNRNVLSFRGAAVVNT